MHRLTALKWIPMFTICGVITNGLSAQPEPTAQPPAASGWRAVTVVEGLKRPWGMDWLPDGRPIVTEKEGTLKIVDGHELKKVDMEDLPDVFDENQGGLFDISVATKSGSTPRIYLTLSTGGADDNRTILVRGTFDGDQIKDIETLFEVEPAKGTDQHFGSRLLWLPEGVLLMSVGDGGNPPATIGGMLAREQAQNLGSHLGSIVCLTTEGKPAPTNPFLDKVGALPEIWSYGHRNIQGLALDPQTGRVWANEHGPLGGDELNLVKRGANHGWPLQTLGRDYRTGDVIGQPAVEGMVKPKVVWTPAHAPSGLAFYTGDQFPHWRGSLFSGGLVSKDVRRIAFDAEGKVTEQDRIEIGDRVRDVRQGPDGYLYVLTDEENGRLIRIEPES